MKTKRSLLSLLFVTMLLSLSSCESKSGDADSSLSASLEQAKANTQNFEATLQKHLQAVMDKDIKSLKETLATSGTLHLILPSGAMTNTVKNFVEGQAGWFQDTSAVWSIEMEVTYKENGPKFGYALVAATYREDERNGKPYTNKMMISYVFKNLGDRWVMVKDHASTVK